MRRFIVHVYPQFPCDFPHQTFRGDYEELVRRKPNDEMVLTFLNTHTLDFLRHLMAVVPPLLTAYVRFDNNTYSSTRRPMTMTFLAHFEALRETKRPYNTIS